MIKYTKRVQSVLTREQYETLLQLSSELGKPVSVLIREAVDVVYFAQVKDERRQSALQTLLSLDAPVADWKQMETEIITGAVE